MTMPVNYPKGYIPNYSGVTINITNPMVNPTIGYHNPNCCNHCYTNPQQYVDVINNDTKTSITGIPVNNTQETKQTINPITREYYPTETSYPANYYTNNYNMHPVNPNPGQIGYEQQKPYTYPQNPQEAVNSQYGYYNPIPNQFPVEQWQNTQAPVAPYGAYGPIPNQFPVEQWQNNNPTSQMSHENPEINKTASEQINTPNNYTNHSINAPVYNTPNSSAKATTTGPKTYTTEVAEPEPDLSVSNEIIEHIDAIKTEDAELEKNSKKTRIVSLTNEYIMSLENYLNNPNKEIRLMASKEILTRLDEDRERYDDAALNALLNKMLQDPEKLVRISALSAFSSGLASGNDYTVELLNNIQNNPNANKEDVVQAAKILLKMSAGTEIKYVPIKNKKTENTNSEQLEKNKQQIEQLQAVLQKYKEREIEAMIQQQTQNNK